MLNEYSIQLKHEDLGGVPAQLAEQGRDLNVSKTLLGIIFLCGFYPQRVLYPAEVGLRLGERLSLTRHGWLQRVLYPAEVGLRQSYYVEFYILMSTSTLSS